MEISCLHFQNTINGKKRKSWIRKNKTNLRIHKSYFTLISSKQKQIESYIWKNIFRTAVSERKRVLEVSLVARTVLYFCPV